MNNATISSLVSLIIVALVARRELRASTRVAGRLWIRPAILFGATLLLAVTAQFAAPDRLAALALWVAGGFVVGIVAGGALLRLTTIRPADRPDAVIVQGSFATVGVWFVVLLLRIGARLLFGGTTVASNAEAGVGTVTVVAVASAVLATAFHRAIAARAVGPV